MITTPTVLVLGAGASQPYGYPLGQGLVDLIVAHGRQSSEFTTPAALGYMLRCGFLETQIRAFAEALARSGRLSVDAFLESRGDFLEVGRAAIANELLEFEQPHDIFVRTEGRWYQYLFNKMCDPNQFESFGQSKLSIITFNYDRSLEFYLFSALQNSFEKTEGECVQIFQKIPIIHVHGQLGPAPTGGGWPKYGAEKTPDLIKFSANQLKIVHEADEAGQEFTDARARLKDAARICFLGFGFHPTNTRRLLAATRLLNEVQIFSSGFGFTGAEKNAVQEQLYSIVPDRGLRTWKINWGNRDHSCEQYLRESGALLG